MKTPSIAVFAAVVLVLTSSLIGIGEIQSARQTDIEIPDDLSGGYAERIDEIIGRAESGEITDEQMWVEIQDIQSLAPRHEVPPWEWQSPPTTIIEQGSGVEAASYIIFLDDDGVCYAKSGDNGEIMYSGDNSTVIQATIDALDNNGGIIFVKRGTYELSATINISSMTFLNGDGFGTIFDVSALAVGILVQKESTDVVLSNFTVDGKDTTSDALIRVENSERVTVRNVKAINSANVGIAASAVYGESTHIFFLNNIAIGNVEDDLTFEGSNYGVKQSAIIGNVVFGIHAPATSSPSMIEVDDGSEDVIIANNVLTGIKSNGISIHHHDGKQPVKRVLVHGNMVNDFGGEMVIRVTSFSANYNEDITFAYNVIDGCDNYAISYKKSKGGQIVGNEIYDFARAGYHGIELQSVQDIAIRNNISRTTTAKQHVRLLENVEATVVEGNIFENGHYQIYATSSGHLISNNLFDTETNHAIWLASTSDNVQIINNKFIVRSASYDAIVEEGSNCYISGNIFEGSPGSNPIRGAGDAHEIVNNKFAETWNAIFDTVPPNSIIKNNLGYTTENSGTALIPNGAENLRVAHGLASAPSIVTLTGTGSDTSAGWVENINAENFDIALASTVSADENVYWYAEV